MIAAQGFLATALLAGGMGTANAVAVTWVDSIDFNPDRNVGWFESSATCMTLATTGYSPFHDFIYDHSLSVNLFDDGGFLDLGETVPVDVPGWIATRKSLSARTKDAWIAVTAKIEEQVRHTSEDFLASIPEDDRLP
jgi:hypothetical protein